LLKTYIVVLLSVFLTGCMAALDSGGSGSQVSSGWPTAPAQTQPGTALDEPIAPSATAQAATPTTGQLAPEPPTNVPATPPTTVPVSTPAEIVIPVLPQRTPEEIWRAQQIDRKVFAAMQSYATRNSTLWWFDPLTQQHIALGGFSGQFMAQAEFTLKGQNVAALEIPYEVNRSYGLTALSPATLQRIEAAGFSNWIETYVLVDANVQPL
jgi:hypothetical protein